ncbi:hypothetical protein, partial [Enterobacter sp. BIGb0359]|uniref:hypothetical protein n=1 Tax=Enterobacter sp. BIGb0359 TaxID=2485133 RepID=UPI001C863C50
TSFFRSFLSSTLRYIVKLFTCSVSMEAHYRELFGADKGKFKKTFRSLTFPPGTVKKAVIRRKNKQKRARKARF